MGWFWILLIVALIWLLVSVLQGRQSPPDRRRTALEILEERYARGEIDREEYLRKKADLIG